MRKTTTDQFTGPGPATGYTDRQLQEGTEQNTRCLLFYTGRLLRAVTLLVFLVVLQSTGAIIVDLLRLADEGEEPSALKLITILVNLTALGFAFWAALISTRIK